jgi:hypothetical protein
VHPDAMKTGIAPGECAKKIAHVNCADAKAIPTGNKVKASI